VVPSKISFGSASPFHICPCAFPAACAYVTAILSFSRQMPVMSPFGSLNFHATVRAKKFI
jgi:hypothetical protein